MNTSTLPFSDTIIDPDSVSNDDLLVALRKGKHASTSHPISDLYLIHICLLPFIPLFLWTHIMFPSLYQKTYISQVGRMP